MNIYLLIFEKFNKIKIVTTNELFRNKCRKTLVTEIYLKKNKNVN